MLSVSSGCLAKVLFENACKMTLIREATLISDLGERHLRIDDKWQGLLDALLADVVA